MSTLTQTAKKDFSSAAGSFDDTASEAKRTVRNFAEDAGSKVRGFMSQSAEQFADVRKATETQITEHPLRSVAIAALSGVILGALLRR